MQFTRIPDSYAPLGGPLIYAFDGDRSDFDVRITDPAQQTAYGAKRFAAATEAAFDIAPYLRRALRFTPLTSESGVHDGSGRMLRVVVAVTDRTTRQTITAPVRVVLPSVAQPGGPALLTAMPRTRLIAAGESDELTFVTYAPLQLTVSADYGPHTTTETHSIPADGLHLFRLNTADFPRADRITVEAGSCGTVVYSVMQPVQEAVRLAWRSRAGSIEHYTFPIEVAAGFEADRHCACGPDGSVSRSDVTSYRTLRSALERREVLEPLAELIATPEVWIVEGARYTPVEVATDRAVVHRYGALRYLEIVIRPKKCLAQPWNC